MNAAGQASPEMDETVSNPGNRQQAATAGHAGNHNGPVDTTVLDDFVGYTLRRAQLHVFQDFGRSTASKDVSPAEFSVLMLAETHPGATQAAIADSLAIEPPRMVVLMNRLESKGLARRIKSASDRRSHGIFLTEHGERELEELKELITASNERCMRRLNVRERKSLMTLLRKLYTT